MQLRPTIYVGERDGVCGRFRQSDRPVVAPDLTVAAKVRL